MPVEDHRQFEAWAKALTALKDATEVHNEALACNVRRAWVDHAKRLLDMAQENYDRISNELDDDA